MKKDLFKLLTVTALLGGALSSCTKELNRYPNSGNSSQQLYSTAAGYKSELAEVYSAFAVTSNSGPGNTDVPGGDAGASDFLRLFWNTQEITTDEGKCAWLNNAGIQDLDQDTWSPTNAVLQGLYDRSIYQITLANSFIAQSSDANIAEHGLSAADATNVRYYRAEARFLRAYQYWVLLDSFGGATFINENSPIGAYFPPYETRAQLFAYVESELKAIDPLLMAPHKNEYGRADQAAEWALLARLYLNAQVYTGTARWADALTYAQKVISAGYALLPKYQDLFLADNNINNTEVIFPIVYDANYTQTYGGTTFLVNSSINNAWSEGAGFYGVPNGGWAGNRSTAQTLTQYFTDTTGKTDTRALFRVREPNLDTLGNFTSGTDVIKFKNVTSTGVAETDASGTFVSTDFPLFRSAEMYLIAAEASFRSGNQAQALSYINTVRERAYQNAAGADLTTLSLNDILNERGREFYWEGMRRTDLIRFGLFTGGTYIWPFKGGTKSGGSIADNLNIFPLPQADLIANPNLKQNPGY